MTTTETYAPITLAITAADPMSRLILAALSAGGHRLTLRHDDVALMPGAVAITLAFDEATHAAVDVDLMAAPVARAEDIVMRHTEIAQPSLALTPAPSSTHTVDTTAGTLDALGADPHFADVVRHLLRPLIDERGLRLHAKVHDAHAFLRGLCAGLSRLSPSRLRLLQSHVARNQVRLYVPTLDELYAELGRALTHAGSIGDATAADDRQTAAA